MKFVVEVERVERVVFREFVTIEAGTKWEAQEAIQDHWVGPDATDHLPEREQKYGFNVIECSTPEEIDSTTEELTVHPAGIADKQ
tara:strand:+ start:227 stop:481 length:255 start_codon:yes stop_codon:yes gene_type:complete